MLDINREHPEYAARKTVWRKYQDLYVGGEQFKTRAGEYLIQRHREPPDIYMERLTRVFYENYVGSIIDWYTATLFRREPVLSFDGPNDAGRRFFAEFSEDCDRKGTSLTEFIRRRFIDALIYGRSHVLVDFPRVGRPAGTRAEEDAAGVSRAYLVGFSPDELINWSVDEHGNYDWVVLRTSYLRKPNIEDNGWQKETRWVYYDRETYRVYLSHRHEGGAETSELVHAGRHGLAKQKRVPLFDLEVPEGLWLMNKAGLLQLEHFNKSNGLAWALTMGLFAMPVIYTDRPFDQIVGESYFLKLAPGDQFGWTEPQGQVFTIASENLTRLQEEIYRVCFLTHAGGSPSGATPQSGLSKQRDFSITNEVLRAYGDAIKDSLKRVLRAIEAAREDGLSVNVTGMDEFDVGDFASELADAEHLLKLGIPSPTLERLVFQKLASKYLCDARQCVKDEIVREIDASRQNGPEAPSAPGQ